MVKIEQAPRPNLPELGIVLTRIQELEQQLKQIKTLATSDNPARVDLIPSGFSVFTTLLDFSEELTSFRQPAEIIKVTMERFHQLIGFTAAAAYTIEDQQAQLFEFWPPYLQTLNHTLNANDITRALAGFNELAEIVNLHQDINSSYELIHLFMASDIFENARSCLLLPLRSKAHINGVICLVQDQLDYYQEIHQKLAHALGNQVALALENVHLYHKAQKIAVVEERHRLARELHDSTSQVLYSILLVARGAQKMLEEATDSPEIAAPLEQIRALSEGGLAEIRTMLFELRPEALSREGLNEALKRLVTALQTRHNLKATLEIDDPIDEIELELKEAIYSIAKEATHNSVKHAQATEIKISLKMVSNTLVLEISDNGQGFNPAAVSPQKFGLRNMIERANHKFGSLVIESATGKGTCLRASFSLFPDRKTDSLW